MKNFIIKYAILTGAILLATKFFDDIHVANWQSALLFALVLGFLNAFLKPIVKLISLPVRLLTLGLFSFVINGIMIKMADYFIQGYVVKSWLTAILLGTLLTILTSSIDGLLKDDNDD